VAEALCAAWPTEAKPGGRCGHLSEHTGITVRARVPGQVIEILGVYKAAGIQGSPLPRGGSTFSGADRYAVLDPLRHR
jgi:hypothetical protein